MKCIESIRFSGLSGFLFAATLLFAGMQALAQTHSPYGGQQGWTHSIHPAASSQSPPSAGSYTAPGGQDAWREFAVAAAAPNPAHSVPPHHPGSGSLWSEASLFNSPFDFEPVNSFEVGDHIVIFVRDNFRSRENTRYKNETDSTVDVGFGRFLWHDFTGDPFLDVDFEAEEEYEGKSRGDMTSVLTVEIQTEVKKVLPDGRLMIEGRTSRIIGRDIKQVLITGILRPEDVNYATMSAEGSRVLDMQVKWEGNGPGPNVLKPGFIHRFLDYFPLF